MTPTSRRHRMLFVVVVLVTLALLVAPGLTRAVQPDGLRAAWDRAQRAGSYHFASDVVQTTMPSATVTNVGRRSHEERLRLEGQTDLRKHGMELHLWAANGSVSQANSGLAVKVEGNKTWMRKGDAAWQPAGNLTGAVAPNGDFMVYLRAVKDVRNHGRETRAGRTFTRYSFGIDSATFAANMRDQLEAAMTQRGELPPGMHLDVPGYYAQMTGRGELWVGDDGLPLRQLLSLQFPSQKDEAVSADVSVDFAQWGTPVVGWLPSSLSNAFFALSANPTPALSVVFWVGVAFVLIRTHRSRRLQRTIPVFVIAALVLSPVLTGHKAYAFMTKQAAQSAAQTQDQSEAKLRQGMLDAQAQSQWNANANPLNKVAAEQGAGPASYSQFSTPNSALALPPDNTTDSDGDGLTDYQEALIGTSSATSDDNKDNVPDGRDSDDDALNDNVEIGGFSYNGRMWYTNPLDADTNHDGIADTMEWRADANNNNIPDDTDGDGVPDLFDDDNDGDGVPDRQDMAPFVHSRQGANTQYLSETKPLTLTINGLQAGTFTYVDFQIRPKEPKHLWYAYNVLDWPEDRQAQIQDDDNGTFADVAASEGRQASPNEAWGDMKLVPMLEIRMSASNNNLPPQAELTPYNISSGELSEGCA